MVRLGSVEFGWVPFSSEWFGRQRRSGGVREEDEEKEEEEDWGGGICTPIYPLDR